MILAALRLNISNGFIRGDILEEIVFTDVLETAEFHPCAYVQETSINFLALDQSYTRIKRVILKKQPWAR